MPRRTRQLSNHWLEICRGSLLASVVIPQSLAYGGSSFEADAGPEKLAQVVREIDLSWIVEDRVNHGGGEYSGGGEMCRFGEGGVCTDHHDHELPRGARGNRRP
jgi:hypothetical protein